MEKNPDDRFHNCADLVTALDTVLASLALAQPIKRSEKENFRTARLTPVTRVSASKAPTAHQFVTTVSYLMVLWMSLLLAHLHRCMPLMCLDIRCRVGKCDRAPYLK